MTVKQDNDFWNWLLTGEDFPYFKDIPIIKPPEGYDE